VTKLEVERWMTTSDDGGHDDGDDERGDTGQPGKRKGVRERVTETRAPTTNTNPQCIWSLFGFAYDSPTLSFHLSAHHSPCMAQHRHHVQEHNTYPVRDITSHP
jgi:hypothetical protein